VTLALVGLPRFKFVNVLSYERSSLLSFFKGIYNWKHFVYN